MKSVAVFCGSNSGNDPYYLEVASEVGSHLAEKGISIVYGGAKIGLMGAMADAALNSGGHIIGVLPDFLRSKEIKHPGLSEFISVTSMHERKAKMNDLCDSVLVMPGGLGTLDEVFEMLTWAQLGLHSKPIGFLNIRNYFSPLVGFLDEVIARGFMKDVNKRLWLIDSHLTELLNKMETYKAEPTPKWIREDQL